MEQLLFKLGIASWAQDIITPIPTTAATTFQIGKTLPTNVGFIYGLSTYADGLDPEGNTLITTTQAQGLYLNLQDGATQFFESIRMDDLLNTFAGTPVVRPQKYMPVCIPDFDLSKSVYQNPNSFISGTIRLKIWYVQTKDWKHVKEKMFPKH